MTFILGGVLLLGAIAAYAAVETGIQLRRDQKLCAEEDMANR
jgi:hypothetical protein